MEFCFGNYVSKEFDLTVQEESLLISSRMLNGKHNYHYSSFVKLQDIGRPSCLAFCLVADNGVSLSLAIVFYDGNREKVGGGVFPVNQLNTIETPKEAVFFKYALRMVGAFNACVRKILIGDESSISQEVNNIFSFPELTNFPLDQAPLILVETLFCDVERDQVIIERYLSYFSVLIQLMRRQIYKKYYWMISISSDKHRAIEIIRERVSRLDMSRQVFLNIYEHPATGYNVHEDDHIDRLRKPNATIPEYREIHTERFRNWLIEKDVSFEKLTIVRLAIDDDDFVSSLHLCNVASAAHSVARAGRDTMSFVSFDRIGIIYNDFGGFTVDEVLFSKMLTGAKFAVREGDLPTSPFAITENFPAEEGLLGGVFYTKVTPWITTFFYNRHGANLSNANKRAFYIQSISERRIESPAELIAFIG